MPTYRDLIAVMTPVRLRLVSTGRASTTGEIRSVTFKDLCQYVWNNFESDSAARRVLYVFCKESEPIEREIERNHVEQKWKLASKHPYYCTVYRILRLLTPFVPRENCVDRRLLEVYNALGKVQEQKLLLNKFFTASSVGAGSVSSFEKILYLATYNYAARTKTGPAQTKSRLTKTGKRVKFHCFPSQDDLERLGFALRKVLEAWTLLASFLLQDSVETMILPYISFQRDRCWFEILPAGAFAPASQNVTLLEARGGRSDAISRRLNPTDTFFRNLANLLLQHIVDYCTDGHLYNLSKGEETQWPRLNDLVLHYGEERPSCFSELNRNVLLTMRRAVALESNRQPGSYAELKDAVPPEARSYIWRHGFRENGFEHLNKGACPPNCTCEYDRTIVYECMRHYVRAYLFSFQELIEEDEMAYDPNFGISIVGNTQFVLMDPPHNFRGREDPVRNAYDTVSKDEINEAVKVVAQLLRPGGHCIIFCSYELLSTWMCSLETFRNSDGAYLFDIDPSPLVFVPEVGQIFPKLQSRTLNHKSVTDIAIHFSRKGKMSNSLEMQEYTSFNHVPSTMPAWSNVMDRIPRLAVGEQLQITDLETSRTRALRPEQKSVQLLKELIERYSKPGDIVADLFAGTFSTAAACLKLPHHRVFVGCENDDECFYAAERRLVDLFSEAIVLKKHGVHSNIAVSNEVEAAAQGVYNHLHGKVTKKSSPSVLWEAPSGLPGHQCFPFSLQLMLGSMWGDITLATALRGITPDRWPSTLQANLNQEDPQIIRAHDASANGLYIAKCTMQDEEVEGLFAARSFEPTDCISVYFGTLVYRNLYIEMSGKKVYGHGVLGCSVSNFKKNAISFEAGDKTVRKAAADHGRIDGNAFIVPSPFCAAGTARKSSSMCPKLPANAIIQFSKSLTGCTKERLEEYGSVHIKAKNYIQPGAEIIVE